MKTNHEIIIDDFLSFKELYLGVYGKESLDKLEEIINSHEKAIQLFTFIAFLNARNAIFSMQLRELTLLFSMAQENDRT